MDLRKAKIYSDGNHYIAIRRTTRPKRPKRIKHERVVEVYEEDEIIDKEENSDTENEVLTEEKVEVKEETEEQFKEERKPKQMTLKELFDLYYSQTVNLRKKDRRKTIENAMRKHFSTDRDCQDYVDKNFERVQRNLMSRKIRLMRKINMHPFNYFVTFTYDDKLHTEETFKKKLKCYLYHMSGRYDWRYIGVWERTTDTNRLHFHGMFIIPDISIVGEMQERRDYNTKSRRMQTVHESIPLVKKFGRNDFRVLDVEYTGGEALNYILKYIEKTGTKLERSGNLPAYVIGDVLPDDIMCHYGDDENKFVLADDFLCISEGEVFGAVSNEALRQMPKEN